MHNEPPSILETVLRVALCQPASCNWTAKSSCVQPLRSRSFLTCRRIKFSFFISTPLDSQVIQSSLCAFHTSCNSQFYRQSTQRVVTKASQLLRWRWQRFFTGTLVAKPETNCVQGLNKVHFGKYQPTSPGGTESTPREVFLWGHQADRKPAV